MLELNKFVVHDVKKNVLVNFVNGCVIELDNDFDIFNMGEEDEAFKMLSENDFLESNTNSKIDRLYVKKYSVQTIHLHLLCEEFTQYDIVYDALKNMVESGQIVELTLVCLTGIHELKAFINKLHCIKLAISIQIDYGFLFALNYNEIMIDNLNIVISKEEIFENLPTVNAKNISVSCVLGVSMDVFRESLKTVIQIFDYADVCFLQSFDFTSDDSALERSGLIGIANEFNLNVSNFPGDSSRAMSCVAGKLNTFIVTPDMRLIKCPVAEARISAVGHVNGEGIVIDWHKVGVWTNTNGYVLSRRKCVECAMLPTCFGDTCPMKLISNDDLLCAKTDGLEAFEVLNVDSYDELNDTKWYPNCMYINR